MSVQVRFHALLGIAGLALMLYAALTAAGRIPVPYLIPPRTERDRQKQRSFYAISYGGMGAMAVLEMLDYCTEWTWVVSLSAVIRIVLIVYILFKVIFNPYIPGYMPGDTADRAAEKARLAQQGQADSK